MKIVKIIIGTVVGLVVIGGIVLVFKLISGAFTLLGGLIDVVLGVAVVAALIAIVLWMFSYAKKHR